MDLRILKIKHLLPIVIVLSFLLSYFVPGGKESQAIYTILTVSGILFAIVVGFFITDLWSRFEKIRTNVAVEVSGLMTYFSFVKVLGKFNAHKSWAKKQVSLIDKYVRKFVTVEWHDYEKTDPEFNAILDSLQEIKKTKTNKETETYTNLLPVLSSVSDAREKLIIVGKDKLSKAEWIVILLLSSTLIFSLFYLKQPTPTSIVFTSLLTSVTIVLLLVLQDLNDLSFGEEIISFEPYEKIFDLIGKPRFYLKRDIERGRIKPPRDKKYRTD